MDLLVKFVLLFDIPTVLRELFPEIGANNLPELNADGSEFAEPVAVDHCGEDLVLLWVAEVGVGLVLVV